MKIHEYQAKELLRKFGVPTPESTVVYSAEEAGRVAYENFVANGKDIIVLKAQIHAGGRGKGTMVDAETGEPLELFDLPIRGVTLLRIGNIADSAYQYASKILGNKLVTIQTGEKGKIVNRLLLEEGVKIKKEFYLSITLDRSQGLNMIMASTEGGMDIEKVAAETPHLILKETIPAGGELSLFDIRGLAFGLELEPEAFDDFLEFVPKLVKAYGELDASLLEINPLVLTHENKFIALDAKIAFDDNALYRHPEFLELRDETEEDPLEVEASRYDINYIKLDGNVGCMVNGAGLAMATMDMIQMSGGKPANFLDVGGGADPDRIANAFRIMLSDKNVETVLINIFGGIVRCDKVADGIIQALNTIDVTVPVIVRLDGTNAIEAKEKLQNSGMDFKVATTLKEAAELVNQTVAGEYKF